MSNSIIITPEIVEKIKNIKEYAENHIFSKQELQKIVDGKLDPVGDNENFVVYIDFGYRVTYSLEKQLDNKIYHHISVSLNHGSKLPSVDSVNFIMELFGMRRINEDMFNNGTMFFYFEHNNMIPNIVQLKN